MTHEEITSALIQAGFETGWVVKGEKIVMWLNEEPVPSAFANYLELDSE